MVDHRLVGRALLGRRRASHLHRLNFVKSLLSMASQGRVRVPVGLLRQRDNVKSL